MIRFTTKALYCATLLASAALSLGSSLPAKAADQYRELIVRNSGEAIQGFNNDEQVVWILENFRLRLYNRQTDSYTTFSGASTPFAFAANHSINESGDIAGYTVHQSGNTTHANAAIFTGNAPHILDNDDTHDSQGFSLNDSGLVVGAKWDAQKNPHAAIFDGQTVRLLNDGGAQFSSLLSVNNAGIAVGILKMPGSSTIRSFYVDTNNSGNGITLLPESIGRAEKINNNNLVLCDASSSNRVETVIYDLNTGHSRPIQDLDAFDINDKNAVVGLANANGLPGAIFDKGQLTQLNSLLVPGSPYPFVTNVFGINDKGEIIAFVSLHSKGGSGVYAILKPVISNHTD